MRSGVRNGGQAYSARRCALAAVLAVLSLPLAVERPEAAALKMPTTPYRYTVIDQDLPAALQELGSNLAIKVNVSPEVKGRIQGRMPEGTAQDFLERVAANYNLEWYYDGSVLYITSARESRTQLLVLSPIPFDRLKAALDALEISDARFPIRPAPGKAVVMVSGPPRYVTLVEQTLAGLVAEEHARPKPGAEAAKAPPLPKVTTLTVFRGGQMTVFRDGRPERLIGPESEPAPRSESGAAPAAAALAAPIPAPGAPAPGVPAPAGVAPPRP
ncbi:nodulation protein NolW [Methylorubrum rhodesianum]|uniref:nodulation protein NolW n=1 Tax=Methylorubrum rhodesianum TaxID=29427 RepID=UPI003CFF57EA